MPQPIPPGAVAGQQPQAPDRTFGTFAGLKNTVPPELLSDRDLSRARNVDLDDNGGLTRRRGRRRVASGRWTSIFTTRNGTTFGVVDGALVLVFRNYTTVLMMPGVADEPLSWLELGPTLYASSRFNSFQVDLPSLQVRAWGRVVDHSYQPGLEPAAVDFWLSPVTQPDFNPETALGAVGGKLLGAPPPGRFIAYHNGRIYVAAGSTLWATELYLYDYVDKTRGYRQYEAEITGLCSVEDGLYVGTRNGVYWVSGRYGEEQRVLKERGACLPGSMVEAPGELLDPEGRRFPDLPRPTQQGMVCTTAEGMVVGLGGGQTYNVTRNHFHFPAADRAQAFFREEGGVNAYVAAMHSSGQPTSSARFGDYVDVQIIRAADRTPGQPGTGKA